MTGKRKDPLGGWRGSTTAGQRISVSTLKRWKLKKNCTPNTPSCRTFPNEPSFPALWNTTLMAGSRVSGSSVLSSVRFTSLLSPRVVKEQIRLLVVLPERVDSWSSPSHILWSSFVETWRERDTRVSWKGIWEYCLGCIPTHRQMRD